MWKRNVKLKWTRGVWKWLRTNHINTLLLKDSFVCSFLATRIVITNTIPKAQCLKCRAITSVIVVVIVIVIVNVTITIIVIILILILIIIIVMLLFIIISTLMMILFTLWPCCWFVYKQFLPNPLRLYVIPSLVYPRKLAAKHLMWFVQQRLSALSPQKFLDGLLYSTLRHVIANSKSMVIKKITQV